MWSLQSAILDDRNIDDRLILALKYKTANIAKNQSTICQQKFTSIQYCRENKESLKVNFSYKYKDR